ncbi:MAG: ATP synthase F1 subunit gamma [bacterium]
MPAGTKTIQRRIKSVTNTKKITKAMEMVAAAKMRKATTSVLGTRPYSGLAWQIIGNIGKIKEENFHPLLSAKEKKSGKSMVILITSDKGLCGGFNAQMFREIKNFVRSHSVIPAKAGIQPLDFIILGKKGEGFAYREKFSIAAVFENLTNNPKFTDIKSIAKMAMDKFIDGTYDKVYVAYTDYVSTLVQKPCVRQLLPIIRDEDLGSTEKLKNQKTEKQDATEYLFEPEKNELLEMLLPKIVETQVFQAVLESVASEHSARMVAMKNATDAAKDMVDDLRFAYNKIRQASITREISEISAGKAALE